MPYRKGGFFLYTIMAGIPGFSLSTSGVGTNTPDNYAAQNAWEEQQRQLQQAGGAVLGAAGKAIDTVGKATGNILPDFKISEKLERLGGMMNPKPAYAADNSGSDLVRALVSNGYSQIDAQNAANGPNADRLRNEYLKSGDNSSSGFKTDTSKTGSLLSAITPTSSIPDFSMEGYFGSLRAAAEAGDQAAIDQLNQVYGQQEETLYKQYEQAGADQAMAERELALQLTNAETATKTQSEKAKESVMTESEKAAEAARSAQRQNRNIMRALGILGSTYAAEALQNPMNELAKQKATFAKWGMDQMATLDQNLTKFKNELSLQKDKILSQYATIKQKIQDDIRYTQQQKATSLAALKAGAQQNLASIQGQMMSYQQQLDQQKLGFTQQIAQILLNKNPNADIGTIMAQAMKTTGQMFPASQQVATVAATPGRNTLSGFNWADYQSKGWNDQQSAYMDWQKKNNSLNA